MTGLVGRSVAHNKVEVKSACQVYDSVLTGDERARIGWLYGRVSVSNRLCKGRCSSEMIVEVQSVDKITSETIYLRLYES